MKTHDLVMPEPEARAEKFAEAQVIILFIIHFKEKFSKNFFLIV
jgi:hypothetical protein